MDAQDGLRGIEAALAAAASGEQPPEWEGPSRIAAAEAMAAAAGRLAAALAILPTDSGQIALHLEARGMRGNICISRGCPLGNYLGNLVGGDVTVGPVCITVDSANWHLRVDTPEFVRDFLADLDSGLFPPLVDDGQKVLKEVVPDAVVRDARNAFQSRGVSAPTSFNREATDHDL